MQCSVEKTSELERKITVSIPEDTIQEKMESRFKSLSLEVKIDGFRPGKVPIHVVKKKYTAQVRGEVMEGLIKSSYGEALQQQKLNPVHHPHIHPIHKTSGLEYVAEFEVYATISLDEISTLEIKRPVATVQSADIESMISGLRKQQIQWLPVDHACTQDDRATINFSGTCEGENITDGKVEHYVVELGSNHLLPGFEEALIGLEVGANKTFTLTLPESYDNKKLIGKTAEFNVELVEVEEGNLPEIDAEFIEKHGVKDGAMDSFKAYVKTNMERELDRGLKDELRRTVMDVLYEKIKVTAPKFLIAQEAEVIMKSYQANAKKQNKSLEEMDFPKDFFTKQAERRVVLGLILSEIVRKHKIKSDDEKVHSALAQMAKAYDKPDDIIKWYYADKTRLHQVQQAVLEEKTIEWVVAHAKISDEVVDFERVMRNTYH